MWEGNPTPASNVILPDEIGAEGSSGFSPRSSDLNRPSICPTITSMGGRSSSGIPYPPTAPARLRPRQGIYWGIDSRSRRLFRSCRLSTTFHDAARLSRTALSQAAPARSRASITAPTTGGYGACTTRARFRGQPKIRRVQ